MPTIKAHLASRRQRDYLQPTGPSIGAWEFLNKTSGQRVLTKGRIALALVKPAAGESILKPRIGRHALSPANKFATPCSCCVCCLHSLMHFNGLENPKLPIPWAHQSPQPKRNLDRFIRFCRADCCDQQTDKQTQTNRPRYNCSKRPLLSTPCVRCGPITETALPCC